MKKLSQILLSRKTNQLVQKSSSILITNNFYFIINQPKYFVFITPKILFSFSNAKGKLTKQNKKLNSQANNNNKTK